MPTLQFLKDTLAVTLNQAKALRKQIADHPDTKKKPAAKKSAGKANVNTKKPARTSKKS